MSISRSDILLHPVRLRVVLAVAGDEATTTEIAKRLPDVPQATLYRHIAKLADVGILEISGERRARGAVERTFRVNTTLASIDSDEAAIMTVEQHLQAFTTFAAILVEGYGRYLDDPDSSPATDGVSFRQTRLWLTDRELAELVADVTTALAPYVGFRRTKERTPRLLSTVLMPEPLQGKDRRVAPQRVSLPEDGTAR